MPPSAAAVSCEPPASTGPSSWAACGSRLAMSQHAALTPPTGHRWRQEHLNPVKGFALLPPTPHLALPLFSASVLERSHQVVIMPTGIIKGKSKLGWGVQKSEMMTLAEKFSFRSWHWWLVTSNVTLPFGVMLALMLLKRGLQALTGASRISGPGSSFGLLIKNKTLLIIKMTCFWSLPFYALLY